MAYFKSMAWPWKIATTVAALALVFVLGGCESEKFDAVNHDYRQRHPLKVEPVLAQSWIDFTNADQPTARDGAKLGRFFSSFIAVGHDPVIVTLNNSGLESKNIDARMKSLQLVASAAGLRSYEMEIVVADNVETADKATAGASLSFRRYVVQRPPCQDWSKSNIADVSNTIHSNFGCATQSNFAAMVADPLDLVRMRKMPPPTGASVDTAVRTVRMPLGHPRRGTGTVSAGAAVLPPTAGSGTAAGSTAEGAADSSGAAAGAAQAGTGATD